MEAGASAKKGPARGLATPAERKDKAPLTFNTVVTGSNDHVDALADEVVDDHLSGSDGEPSNSSTERDGDDIAAIVSGLQQSLDELKECRKSVQYYGLQTTAKRDLQRPRSSRPGSSLPAQ